MPWIRPCAAGAVKALGLVHRQQRSRSSDLDTLLAKRSSGGVQGTPAAGGRIIGSEHRLADRLLLRFGRNERRIRLITHDRDL